MHQELETYFPQPGNGPEVIQTKALLRQQMMKGVRGEAGRAYTNLGPADRNYYSSALKRVVTAQELEDEAKETGVSVEEIMKQLGVF